MKIETPWGYVETLNESKDLSVSMLVIHPGKEVPNHYHKVMKEVEVEMDSGAVHVWKQGEPHGYKNNTDKEKRVLCIAIPGYDPTDEYSMD